MIEIKSGADCWVPVRLLDVTGNAVTGVAAASVTVSLRAADAGAIDTYTPSMGQWLECSGGAFASTGIYQLIVPGSYALPQGSVMYAVSAAGATTYIGAVKCVTYEESDTYVHMRRLQEGRWKIHTSGPDANRLVLYSADGVTALQKWDLLDSSGSPTAGVNVFERTPTETIP